MSEYIKVELEDEEFERLSERGNVDIDVSDRDDIKVNNVSIYVDSMTLPHCGSEEFPGA